MRVMPPESEILDCADGERAQLSVCCACCLCAALLIGTKEAFLLMQRSVLLRCRLTKQLEELFF
jgi:hypothetical protein